jgi:hypothetical protein
VEIFSLRPEGDALVEFMFFLAHRDEGVDIQEIAHGNSASASATAHAGECGSILHIQNGEGGFFNDFCLPASASE